MKLAIIQRVERSDGKVAILLERDLVTFKERLSNIAYEYYVGFRNKIITDLVMFDSNSNWIKEYFFEKYFKELHDVNDEIMKKIIKDSLNYAFDMLEREIKKETINANL